MASAYTTRNGRTSKRGVFIEGVWHCDCEPRLPADKFQTKNGGKNHGRWCKCIITSRIIPPLTQFYSLHLPETPAQTLWLLPMERRCQNSRRSSRTEQL